MISPGDVVTCWFVGEVESKRRPVVVLSTRDYHRHRRDAIIGVLTSKFPSPLAPSDYVLLDWQQASLNKPTVFRAYLMTDPIRELKPAGRLSVRDWAGVQNAVRNAIQFGPE